MNKQFKLLRRISSSNIYVFRCSQHIVIKPKWSLVFARLSKRSRKKMCKNLWWKRKFLHPIGLSPNINSRIVWYEDEFSLCRRTMGKWEDLGLVRKTDIINWFWLLVQKFAISVITLWVTCKFCKRSNLFRLLSNTWTVSSLAV